MSLVYPIASPQCALRACAGHFVAFNQNHVALLYSDRVVFRELVDATLMEESTCIYIPRPEMTIGDSDRYVAPNLGGAFFAVGRTKDMIAMQVGSALMFLSLNLVSGTFELQGSWGVPKDKSNNLIRPVSARSISSLTLSEPVTGSSSSIKSKIGMRAGMPLPQPSPDGTHVFLATRGKGGHAVLVLLSCYGDELIRLDTDYAEIMTLGWITDDLVYFVYTNGRFHKKFQVCRLKNKMRQTGLFGMGRKSAVRPSMSYEINILLAADFQSSVMDTCGGTDLVFSDHVLLATKGGTYVRVNHRNGAWEPVLNIRNVVGALCMGTYGVVIQNSIGHAVPHHATQLSYSVASGGGSFKAVKCDLAVSACLASTHDIDGMNRYVLKLLRLNDTQILDFKRQPMRVYQVSQKNSQYIEIADDLEVPPVTTKSSVDFLVKTDQALYTRDPNGDDDSIRKIVDRKVLVDIVFDRPGLVKVAKRDSRSLYAVFNGVNFEKQQHPPEIKVVEESHRNCNLKTKALYRFTDLQGWYILSVVPLHNDTVLVGLSSEKVIASMTHMDEFTAKEYGVKWALYLVSFVGSIGKQTRAARLAQQSGQAPPLQITPPRAYLLMKSAVPDVMPIPLRLPGLPSREPETSKCYSLSVYNTTSKGFSEQKVLTVRANGEYDLRSTSLDHPFPYVLQQDMQATFFTDYRDPLNSVFLAGIWPDSQRNIKDVLLVESPEASDGSCVMIYNPDVQKTAIWLFDSNGTEFRELTVCDKTNDLNINLNHHQQQLRATAAPSSLYVTYEISPQFTRKFFKESCSNNRFRPLPELQALVCQGAGFGTDAEAYIKTPDCGIYAIFRIQNKKLLEMLKRLMCVVLENRIGNWLPDSIKTAWLSDMLATDMIAGNTFLAFYELDESEQLELCKDADVDIDVMRKVRPP
ncbi:hypothetical protein DASB73_040090 [Starmerella bacillaris]|uniref:Cleavage/polyadenylation specificity factor A subunit N-terminal domain-containing protein n=1 Tax=Starmerella bacillaris TaxID=1247836 RepID=A0AAV5RPJ1_STABA|nr:hypothetical protein DASB73_040090 [Starmerella bacillaris]